MTFAHSFVLFNAFLLGVTVFDFKNWSRNTKIVAVITLIICLLGLALTFTRGVWIGFAVAIICGAFVLRPKWGVLTIAAFLILSVTAYNFVDQFRYKIQQTRLEMNGHSERKDLWRAHLYIFRENPIFGLGYGQNTRQLPEYYKILNVPEGTLQSHAHNQYIHLMAGTGILGFFSYIIIWGYFLMQMFKLWRLKDLDSWERGVVFGILLGSIAFLIGGLTEANFEHSKVRFAVMLIWAYIVYLAKKHKVLGWQLGQK
jgi:O-antigen ligase